MPAFSYGTGHSLELEFDSDARVTVCDVPRGTPIADLTEATRRALSEPLAFPPLGQSVLPGDRVAVAVPGDVPQSVALLTEVVKQLLEGGVDAANITVLTTSASDTRAEPLDLLAGLPDEVRKDLTVKQHDPRNRDSLSYLAATEDATPVYLNRALHEADFVVSIGVLRSASANGYFGIYSSIYPTFSDAATLARFRATAVAQPAEQRRLVKQAGEVGWLLGTRFTLQVVPGAEDAVLAVLAGDVDAVLAAGQQAVQDAWHCDVPSRAGVVVVGISGDESQQSWENVGRVLQVAGRVALENGDVIICSDLHESLGVGLDILTGAENILVALREIDRAKPVDSLVATHVGAALERGRIYLVSGAPRGQLEDLGIHPIDADDVARVTARYDSCIVLPNAQYVDVTCVGETTGKPKTRRSRS
jgi:nickel-dependent lactate racemase